MSSPIGIINGVYLYQADLDWCQKLIDEYEAAAIEHESTAEQNTGSTRAAYLSHAARARKNAERMRQNLAAQQACVGNWDPNN